MIDETTWCSYTNIGTHSERCFLGFYVKATFWYLYFKQFGELKIKICQKYLLNNPSRKKSCLFMKEPSSVWTFFQTCLISSTSRTTQSISVTVSIPQSCPIGWISQMVYFSTLDHSTDPSDRLRSLKKKFSTN